MLFVFVCDSIGTCVDFIIAVRQLGLGHVGETKVRSVFRQLDRNHNGRLDMNEAFNAIGLIKGILGSSRPH